MTHDLSDKQLRTLRDRCEPGLKQGALHAPRDPVQCFAYVMLSCFAMSVDVEIARRAERSAAEQARNK
jgi:hypothetical protein